MDEIDASPLLEMPLDCLADLIADFDGTSTCRSLLFDVIRWVAFMLICGAVVPAGSTPGDGFRRGMRMLSILRAHACRR